MIVHDWTRVVAGIFHDFHHTWIAALKESLNGGLLPSSYYAMAEQVAGGPRPDVLTLEAFSEMDDELSAESATNGTVALAVAPPKVRFTQEAEESIYSRMQNRIAIYHASDDRVVAFIEIVSAGNKHSDAEVDRFNQKVSQLLEAGKHYLMVDVHPPNRHAPRGMHTAFWEHFYGDAPGVTAKEPFCAVAYRVEVLTDKLPAPMAYPTAYFEPFGQQGPLPTMPLFLTPDRYVNVPLDETYSSAWKGVPDRWKKVIDPDSSP